MTMDGLQIPHAMQDRARTIIDIANSVCHAQLDEEYALITRSLVARLARKRPSPLIRGDTRIWAAGAIYAVGQINFLFDRRSSPHMTGDQLAGALGVVKTTMAAKAALINRTLDLRAFEPGLTRADLIAQHPLVVLGHAVEMLFAGRPLPPELRDELRRRELVPDAPARPAA